MADVTGRVLALLSILQSGGSFSAVDLARRLDVSERTVRRDVERLRSYGYPVDARPGPGSYYRLVAGRTMPPLVLGDDEVIATMAALAVLSGSGSPAPNDRAADRGVGESAATAYAKLEQLLPVRLRPRAASVRRSLDPPRMEAPVVAAATFGELAGAVDRREIVTFDYVDGRGGHTARRVEPHRQVYHLLRWYLLAWDVVRDDWRVFRIDRISSVAATGQRFVDRALPAPSALDYVRASIGRRNEQVRVIVEAPVDVVADAFVFQDVDLRRLDDDRCEVVAGFESWQWLLLSLAFLDVEFQVAEPDDFRSRLADFAARLASASR